MTPPHSVICDHFAHNRFVSLSVAFLLGVGACAADTDSAPPTDGAITSPSGSLGGPGGATAGGSAGTDAGGRAGAADGGLSSPADGGMSAAPQDNGATTGGASDGGTMDADTRGDGGVSEASTTRGDATAVPVGGGDGGAGACTRELLQSTVDKYFVALAAHDASTLPLASTVKFTENGKTMMLGAEGMWRTAGMLKHEHSALDVQLCTSASQAVVPEGKADLPFALRLKLKDGRISEVEHIVVREGDYTILGLIPFPSNPADIIASADRVKWKETVSDAERTPRVDMERWANKYFKMFPSGGCNLAPNCERRENGGGNFNCKDALSCASEEPSATSGDPRLIVVDEDVGVAVAFAMFLGHTDMHMVKFRAGTVYAVHAILSAASGPGWP